MLRFDCGHSVIRRLSMERNMFAHHGLDNGLCEKCGAPNLYPPPAGYTPLPVAYYVYQEGAFWSLTPSQWYTLCQEAATHDGAYALSYAPLHGRPKSIKGKLHSSDGLYSDDPSRPLKQPLDQPATWFASELAQIKRR